MDNQNCNHSQCHRYRYKGFLVQVFIEADFERGLILYTASVELPNNKGVISGKPTENRDEAELAAEELINSWN